MSLLNKNNNNAPSAFNLKENKVLKIWVIISAVCLVVIFAAAILLPLGDEQVSSADFLMSTIITQNIYEKNGKSAIDEAVSALRDFEDSYSMHLANSYISKINENAGIAPVTVSDDVFNLIARSVSFSEQTDGAFDITVAPLVSLWDITNPNPKIPSKEDIENAVSKINYKDIVLDSSNKTVMLKNKGQSIDLGAIAKGEACNIVRQIYAENEIKSAFISVGGNMMVYGSDPHGKDFKIGIKDPRSSQNDIIGAVYLSDTTMATSGDYERYFIENDKRYHHIMDVKTGYPSETDLMSVSVISPDGALADFLSTAIFLGGTKNLSQYINSPNYSVIAVDKDYNIYVSDKFKDKFELNEKNKNGYKLAEVNNETSEN